MKADRGDLTDEEWDAIERIHRGAPEAGLVPATLVGRLIEQGYVVERTAGRRLTDRGRALILRERDRKARW